MFDKEFYRKETKKQFKDWTDEQIELHVNRMGAKYATVKQGTNVIHLDYYDGLLDSGDIRQIENDLSSQGYELSRFDKSGVAYNNLHDYTLHLAYYLSDPVVQVILTGIGTNALWDMIKKVSFYTWQRVRTKKVMQNKGRQEALNFGLKLQLGKDTKLELKFGNDATEATTLQALDKVIDLIKDTKQNTPATPQPARMHRFDATTGKWMEIDMLKEIREKIEAEKSQKEES
jgi:hypothetical protein